MEDNISFEITEKNLLEKDRVYIEISKEMVDYAKLIKLSLFDEAFSLLENNFNALEDNIEKSLLVRNFLNLIFDIDVFKKVVDDENVFSYSKVFVEHFQNNHALHHLGDRTAQFIKSEIVNVMLAYLIKKNEFEGAKLLVPFANNNLINYPNTLYDIVEDNNIEALRFVCENMNNINFNEGALLRLTTEMSPEAMKMLIEEFNFDINEQSRETRNNLISSLIKDEEMTNFKFLLSNYGNKINWNVILQEEFREEKQDLFDLINQTSKKLDFYSILLEDLTLKNTSIERIANTIFKNNNTIELALKTDVLSKLFSHPSFDHKLINLGQNYFIYGLYAKIGTSLLDSNFEVAEMYNKVLTTYLDNTKDKEIPNSTNFHVLGAIVALNSYFQKNMGEQTTKATKILLKSTERVLKSYPEYVNIKNPNGTYPIVSLKEHSPIYDLLIKNEAAPLKSRFTLLAIIKQLFGLYKPEVNEDMVRQFFINRENFNKNKEKTQTLSEKLDNNFIEINQLAHDPMCDSVIQYKCDNIYLKAVHIATMIEKHDVKGVYEDIHFLTNNLAKYLHKSLSIYLQICNATVDFIGEDKQHIKLQNAKEQCIDQIDLLKSHLDAINENIFNTVEDSVKTDSRVHSRVLKEKFETMTRTLSIEDMLNSEIAEINKPQNIKAAKLVKDEKIDVNIDVNIFKANINEKLEKVSLTNIEDEFDEEEQEMNSESNNNNNSIVKININGSSVKFPGR